MSTKLGKIATYLNGLLHVKFFFFFLSGFSFTTIHESQDCRGRGRLFLELLTTTSTRFTDTYTLTGRLLQTAHLCTQVAVGLEPGTFGFRVQGHVTNKNPYISTTAVSMATKIGRMITCLDGFLPVNLHDPITLSSRCLVKSCDKLKPSYLQYQSPYGHQTWQDGDLP